MESSNEINDLISKFNSSDDYDILLMIDGNDLSIKEKKYLIENCQKRIDQMDKNIFIQTLRQISQDFCEECSEYLSSKIPTLTVSQIENLLYINKYYHEVSEIAAFLVKQNWFCIKSENEYKCFFTAFEIEKLLKLESINKEKIITIGNDIINLLATTNGSSLLFDMIIKNYLFLLQKYNPQYFEIFKEQGYEIINRQILKDMELTTNMIVFDCGITKIESKSNVDYFEFYEKDDDNAFAYAHAGTVRINIAAMKNIYQQYENKKIGTQMLFYVIGHEIDHVYCERYKSNFDNDLEELRVFNAGISNSLQQVVNREFYFEYHNCFSHEFSANIKGIESLYHKQKYLSSITQKDKEEINKLLATIIFSSYCLVKDDFADLGYVGPVEFSRGEFNKFKDNLPGYAYYALLNNQTELSSKLKTVESNKRNKKNYIR